MTAPPPTRLFRVDTPHDVVAACLVAGRLAPGHDVLALSTDKAFPGEGDYLEALRAVASAHGWRAVVDISGVPMNQHWLGGPGDGSRRQEARDTARSIAWLRERLAPAFGLDPRGVRLRTDLDRAVGEVYLTCLNHPDVQAMYRVLPSARKVYSPHGLGSLHAGEISHYAAALDRSRQRRLRARHVLQDAAKALVWGRDAVPPRTVAVDAAYSFHLPAPWTDENHSLADCLDRPTMQRLFAGLPGAVRGYYESLAARCAPGTPLLLLLPEERGRPDAATLEARTFADLAGEVAGREEAQQLVVKPHPLTGDAWLAGVLTEIEGRNPGLDLVTVERHRFLPVEVVLAPFGIGACAGLWSSSQATLAQIYGLRSYCPEGRLLELAAARGMTGPVEAWIEANRGLYTAV